MTEGSTDAIKQSEDGYVVAAELVAEKFGLSPEAFWREMKRGIVYGVVERGEGEDAGRTRLTFRYRDRSWSVTLKETPQ
jgi:predicted ArsR family transcriptional regulator